MKRNDLIRMLRGLRNDLDIKIECPNGLLVNPSIKIMRKNPLDIFSEPECLVLSWRD